MKNTKWIGWTLGILLVLIAIAGAGAAGFRIGVMQSLPDGTTFDRHSFDRDFPRGFDSGMRGFDHGRDFGGRGGFTFFTPIFGLIRLAVLGGLIWLGYSFFKRNGWRLVNVNAGQTSTPMAEETPQVEIVEKKKK